MLRGIRDEKQEELEKVRRQESKNKGRWGEFPDVLPSYLLPSLFFSLFIALLRAVQ